MVSDPDILHRELIKIASLPMSDLKRGYRKYYRRDPPACFGHDLLRRAIAYAIEEKLHGLTLPRELERALILLAQAEQKTPQGPQITATSLMTMRPGTEFVRVWQGKSYNVIVVENGFLWNGTVWKSLSEIAREITGTRWNGPRFFGLRDAPPPIPAGSAGRRPKRREQASSSAPEPSTRGEVAHVA
jgi:hypothetical protein